MRTEIVSGINKETYKTSICSLFDEFVKEIGLELEPEKSSADMEGFFKPGSKYIFFIAFDDDKINGFSITCPWADYPEIDCMETAVEGCSQFYIYFTYVRPENRKKGIASQLSSVILQYAEQQGFCAVVSRVLKSNEAMIKLRRKMGFQGSPSGRSLSFYRKISTSSTSA